MSTDHLALALTSTIRHDGHGGVTDEIADPAQLDRWVREHARALREYGFSATGTGGGASREVDPGTAEFAPDVVALAAVVEVRAAVRALFARAVAPASPSAADAGQLPHAEAALEQLNAACARVPMTRRLVWPPDGPPSAITAALGAPGPADVLCAALARAAVTFLASADLARLRACPAPRCVLYFVQAHARQEWCKPSCGNRARVARHHARRRDHATVNPDWPMSRQGPSGS